MSNKARNTFLIGAGVGLLSAIFFQWFAYSRLQNQYRLALKNNNNLKVELSAVRTDRDKIAQAFTTQQQRVSELSATLTNKEAELQDVVARLSNEEKVIQDLQSKLTAMQRQLDYLQSELAMSLKSKTSGAKDSGKTVQLEKVVVAPAESSGVGLKGHVVSISSEWSFIVIDLGWNIVNIGDVVSIYRKDQLLGKARVERVQEQVSAATLLPEWMGAEIQINDEVRIF